MMITHRSVLTFNSAENLWEPRNPRTQDSRPPRTDILDLIACALLALLLGSILAFGAVYPPAILTLQLGAAALFLITLATQLAAGTLTLQPKPALLPLLSLCALVLFQLFLHRTAYWYATYEEALLWTAYLLIFITASAAFRTPRAARIALLTLATFGPLVALFAIIQSFTSDGLIYWFHAPYETSRVMFGPYVNRNHYAGMIELLAPFPLVLAFFPRYPRPQRVLALFAAALMYASVVIAASRGGAIACLFQILFFTLLASFSNHRRARGKARAFAAAALLLLAVLTLALWIEPTHMLDRLSSLHLHDDVAGRPTMFRDALRMLPVHPLTGFGLHTFPAVFPAYRSFSTELFVNELHNDFLQIFVELGFLGGIALCAFLYLLLRDSLRLIFARSQPQRLGLVLADPLALLRLAALTGVVGLLLHSFGDFNLHIPANAACFFALCAFSTNTAAAPNAPPSATHTR